MCDQCVPLWKQKKNEWFVKHLIEHEKKCGHKCIMLLEVTYDNNSCATFFKTEFKSARLCKQDCNHIFIERLENRVLIGLSKETCHVRTPWAWRTIHNCYLHVYFRFNLPQLPKLWIWICTVWCQPKLCWNLDDFQTVFSFPLCERKFLILYIEIFTLVTHQKKKKFWSSSKGWHFWVSTAMQLVIKNHFSHR